MFQKKRLISLLTVFFLAGVCVLLFFILLNGALSRLGLDKLYWLQADTSGISGAKHLVSRWTYYRLCGVSGGSNSDCSSSSPGYPLSPKHNFGSSASSSLPSSFTKSSKKYYLLSKFSYAFYLIALFLGLLSLLVSIIAVCGGAVLGLVLTLLVAGTLFFTIISSALITALTVKARNAFRNDGRSASIGTKLMAFTWVSVFILLLCLAVAIWHTCVLGFLSKRHKDQNRNNNDEYSYYSEDKSPQRASSFRRSNTRQQDAQYAKGNRHSKHVSTLRDQPAAFNSPRLAESANNANAYGQPGAQENFLPAAAGAGAGAAGVGAAGTYPEDLKGNNRNSALDALNANHPNSGYGQANPHQYPRNLSSDPSVIEARHQEPTLPPLPQGRQGDNVILSNNQHASMVTPHKIVRRPLFVSAKDKDNYLANRDSAG